MLNTMYSSNPYDTTRPKSFFGDRKKLHIEEVTQGNGGLSYNKSWNKNRKPSPKKINNSKANYNTSLLMISSWAYNFCIVLISLIAVS